MLTVPAAHFATLRETTVVRARNLRVQPLNPAPDRAKARVTAFGQIGLTKANEQGAASENDPPHPESQQRVPTRSDPDPRRHEFDELTPSHTPTLALNP